MSTRLHSMKVWILGLLTGLALGGCVSPTSLDSATDPTMEAISAPRGSFNSVCIKDDISMIGFSGGLSLSGTIGLSGDILLFGEQVMSMAGNSDVEGKIFLDISSEFGSHGSCSVSKGVEKADRSREKRLVEDFASSISDLSPTQEFDILNRETVILGKGGINAIHVSKGIDLAGNDRIVLKGDEKDIFIVNVDGDIRLSGNSAIVLEGGVSARSVVFNNRGHGADITLSGGAVVAGTVLGMERGISMLGHCHVEGTLVAGLEIRFSGSGTSFSPGAFCVTGPEGDHESDGSEDSAEHEGEDEDGDHSSSPGLPGIPPLPLPSISPAPAPAPSPTPCSGPVCNGGVIGV